MNSIQGRVPSENPLSISHTHTYYQNSILIIYLLHILNFVTWLRESRNLPFQQTSTVTIAMAINRIPPTTAPGKPPSPSRKGINTCINICS